MNDICCTSFWIAYLHSCLLFILATPTRRGVIKSGTEGEMKTGLENWLTRARLRLGNGSSIPPTPLSTRGSNHQLLSGIDGENASAADGQKDLHQQQAFSQAVHGAGTAHEVGCFLVWS